MTRVERFLSNAKKSRNNQKELWIIGDINLNWTHYYLDTKDNEDLIEEVKEFMLEEGMTQLVENITRRGTRPKQSVPNSWS